MKNASLFAFEIDVVVSFRERPSELPRKACFFLIGSMHSQSSCDLKNTKLFRSDMFGRERKDGREVNLNEKTHNCLYWGFFIAISLLLITIKNVHYVIIVLKLKEVTSGYHFRIARVHILLHNI